MKNIIAHFVDGREILYTSAILPLLRSDPSVSFIFDAETGEIIHESK